MIKNRSVSNHKAQALAWSLPLFDHLWQLAMQTAPDDAPIDFIRRLIHHQLVPLYLRSGHDRLATIDPGLMEYLLQFSIGNTTRSLSMISGFQKTAQELNSQGIRYALYKGAALSQRIYGDLAARQFGDIDLLIHPDDFYRAFELLVEHGFCGFLSPNEFIRAYLQKSRRDITLSKPSVHLDLHQQIARGPRFYALPKDAWHTLDTLSLYSHSYPILTAETELVTLAVHASRHGWDHYKLILDMAGILNAYPDLDWGKVAHLVDHFQAQTMFDLGILLVQRLFPALASAHHPPTDVLLLKKALERHVQILDHCLSYSDMGMLREFFRLQKNALNKLKLAMFYLAYPRPEDRLLLCFKRSLPAYLLPLIHPPHRILQAIFRPSASRSA